MKPMTKLLNIATWVLASVLIGWIVLIVLVIATKPAKATDWDHGLFGGNAIYNQKQIQRERDINNYKPPRTIRHVEKHHIHKTPRDHDHEGTRVQETARVKGWVMTLSQERNRGQCYAPVRTVGDQWATDHGAKSEAVKAWTQQVRHDHGEHAADFEFAKRASFACVKSSINGIMHRCEVIAMPCPPHHAERER